MKNSKNVAIIAGGGKLPGLVFEQLSNAYIVGFQGMECSLENPSDAQIASHRLMLRAGMIRQAQSGIYSWLPMGYKVLRKLENIVHDEQIRAGHNPMLMPTMQSADLWRESGRYN